MASNHPSGKPINEKHAVEEADALNHVVAKLSVLCDFFKRMGDDSCLLDADSPLGLYLIMGDCIDTLKRLGELRLRE